ncbi:histidine phosphatase family protein [uncultured Sulfitobacter sp.]|uniref:histidine phosphatase family protein n=1 Tax=uncultured Sulfitobacter sp. TaxID=191468 RepID=UPI002605C339|nr:histidine phosphatase family protein [uncultured Sulfitobacter sp.]
MRYIIALVLCLPTGLWANNWDALRAPGAIAIMRHALAPGGGDPTNHTIGDCTTQRNLSDQGRAQARRIGQALRTQKITFDMVYTSQWCRTSETARLLEYGSPREAPALNSFFGKPALRVPQTRDLRAQLERTEGLNIWVTHQVNISALTGTGTSSGEIIVFRLTPDGTEILGRIMIDP